MKSQKRFEDRIGKKIRRQDNGCSCRSCDDCLKNGITVMNKGHAEYLHTCHLEMGIEYYDSKDDLPDCLSQLFGMKK